MKASPVFTIVIPTYNRANFIAKTLTSVCSQSFVEYQVIIVDDGSTDNTGEVIKIFLEDKRFLYLKTPNRERAAARNTGIKHAAGRYITFLDSDDLFLPNHLATAAEKIEQQPHPKVFHLSYDILNGAHSIKRMPKLPSPVNDALLDGNHLSCMGVFIEREIAKNNLFDEDRELSGSEDFELWIRLACQYPIYTFRDTTSRLINHDGRSVVLIDTAKLEKRLSLLEQKVFNNQLFIEKYGNLRGKFSAFRSLYQALHLVMANNKPQAFKNLIEAAVKYPKCILTYRFGVIVKKLVFN
jgi:glycosyltransferase involved in cell wall biosynthesis